MAAQNIISNGFNCIMNGQRAQKKNVIVPSNKFFNNIIKVLVEKKYLASAKEENFGKKNFIKIGLKYKPDGRGVINEIKRHSNNYRRVYSKGKKIPRIKNGFATVIVTTSSGVMIGKEAREKGIGGEIICHVF